MALQAKVGGVYRRVGTRAILALHFPKIFFLGFWDFVSKFKLDPLTLNPKMAFLFGFGAPGRSRRHLQIGKLGFCTFATNPLAPLAYQGLPDAKTSTLTFSENATQK